MKKEKTEITNQFTGESIEDVWLWIQSSINVYRKVSFIKPLSIHIIKHENSITTPNVNILNPSHKWLGVITSIPMTEEEIKKSNPLLMVNISEADYCVSFIPEIKEISKRDPNYLSCRAFNVLTTHGIKRGLDLVVTNPRDMKRWRNCGKKTFKEIETLRSALEFSCYANHYTVKDKASAAILGVKIGEVIY